MTTLRDCRILVTGAAGFIGFHMCKRLLDEGARVTGIDNLSPYYDVVLKRDRIAILETSPLFAIRRTDIADKAGFAEAYTECAPQIVIHLAAQAGVRYSIENPDAYIQSNLVGTFNVLELCRQHQVGHLLAASTSSVYGGNTRMPFHETDRTASPLTLYAATKGGTELMAHSYAHLFNFPVTFFRFFNVYGPWGRPDMALFKFAKAMLAGEEIEIYNNGNMTRDFTYVDDIVEAVARLCLVPPEKAGVPGDSLSEVAPFRIVNIGKGQPVPLMEYVGALERALGMTARKKYLPLQTGDVPATEASPELLRLLTGYIPDTPLDVGVRAFADWFQARYVRRSIMDTKQNG